MVVPPGHLQFKLQSNRSYSLSVIPDLPCTESLQDHHTLPKRNQPATAHSTREAFQQTHRLQPCLLRAPHSHLSIRHTVPCRCYSLGPVRLGVEGKPARRDIHSGQLQGAPTEIPVALPGRYTKYSGQSQGASTATSRSKGGHCCPLHHTLALLRATHNSFLFCHFRPPRLSQREQPSHSSQYQGSIQHLPASYEPNKAIAPLTHCSL